METPSGGGFKEQITSRLADVLVISRASFAELLRKQIGLPCTDPVEPDILLYNHDVVNRIMVHEPHERYIQFSIEAAMRHQLMYLLLKEYYSTTDTEAESQRCAVKALASISDILRSQIPEDDRFIRDFEFLDSHRLVLLIQIRVIVELDSAGECMQQATES